MLRSVRVTSLPLLSQPRGEMECCGGQRGGKETKEKRSLPSMGTSRERGTNGLLPDLLGQIFTDKSSPMSHPARFVK